MAESVPCPFCARPVLITPSGKIPRHTTAPNGSPCLPPYPYPHPYKPFAETQRDLWDADTERRSLKGRLLTAERKVGLLEDELKRWKGNAVRNHARTIKMKETSEGRLVVLRDDGISQSEFPDVWY